MWWRDRSLQTHTWTRSVGAAFLWWRKTPSSTATSTTKTKRGRHTAGTARPPMVRLRGGGVASDMMLTFSTMAAGSRQAQAHLHARGIQLGGRRRRLGQVKEREPER